MSKKKAPEPAQSDSTAATPAKDETREEKVFTPGPSSFTVKPEPEPECGVSTLRRQNNAILRRTAEKERERLEGRSHFLMEYIEINRTVLRRLESQMHKGEIASGKPTASHSSMMPVETITLYSDCRKAWAVVACYKCNLQLIHIFERPEGGKPSFVGIYHRELPQFLVQDKLLRNLKKHLDRRAAKIGVPVKSEGGKKVASKKK